MDLHRFINKTLVLSYTYKMLVSFVEYATMYTAMLRVGDNVYSYVTSR